MKILVIEADESLRLSIAQQLKREGYVCEQAVNFREGYRKIVGYEYDLILMNLYLPGGSGMQLLKLLHENKSAAGLIVFSSENKLEERVEVLNKGADDFLLIPFHLSELVARIRALLRRKADQREEQMDFGELVINLDAREVSCHGTPIHLTRKEYEILLLLARNRNRVVTKEFIAESLWGDYMDEADSFDFIYAHVKNLRRKLLDHGCGDYVVTIYGVGYKFLFEAGK